MPRSARCPRRAAHAGRSRAVGGTGWAGCGCPSRSPVWARDLPNSRVRLTGAPNEPWQAPRPTVGGWRPRLDGAILRGGGCWGASRFYMFGRSGAVPARRQATLTR